MASDEGWINGLRQNVQGWSDNAVKAIKGGWDGFIKADATSGNPISEAYQGAKNALRGDGPDLSLDPSGRLDSGGYDAGKEAVKAQDMKNMQAERALAPGNDYERGPRRMLRTSPVQPHDFTVSPDGTTVPRSAGELAPLPQPQPGGATPPPPPPPGGTPPPAGAGEPSVQRPAWGSGPSPEAQAYMKSQQAASGAPAAEESAGLRGAAKPLGMVGRGVMKALPIAAAGAEFLDPNVRNAVNPNSNVSITDRLKQAARTSLRVGGGILGGVGGATLGSGIPIAGTLAGGAAGGIAGYEAGNKVADWLVGPEPTQPVPQGTGGTAPATPQPPPAAGSAPASTGFRTLAGKAKVDANEFINGTDTPRQGDGYIRNNQTGNVMKMSGGGGMSGLRGGGPSPGGDDIASLRKLAGKGAFGSMAALGAYGAVERQKTNTTNAQLRGAQAQATNELARARMNYEIGKDQRQYATEREDHNAKVADQEFGDYVKGNEPAQNLSMVGGEKPADYEARVGQVKSKLTDAVNYSIGNRQDGKRLGQLSGAERQQLLDGAKFKSAIEKSRGNLLNSAADFFGNKRADSKDLYSYIPSGVEGSVQPFSGGYRIKTANGNTLTVRDAAGGGFNWTGPNDPVDADVMKYIGPYIQQARAQGK